MNITTTQVHTFTVVPLDQDRNLELRFTGGDIWNVPVSYAHDVMGLGKKNVELISDTRIGELRIDGDTRRWFLHRVTVTYDYATRSELILITAD